MNPLVLTLGGLVLFLAGLGLGVLVARRSGGRQAAEELAVVRQDFDAYREGVTRHFRDSAGHFQAIGEQYRALYAHMADGAKHFCAGGPEQEAIEFAPQPGLAAADRKPFTAAAAATALSEGSWAHPGEEDVDTEAAEPLEPALGLEEAESPAAAAEDKTEGRPEADPDEVLQKAADRGAADELESEMAGEENALRDVERKEPQAPGSGLVH